MKYEKEFRKAHPETAGETEQDFDLANYNEWLEKWLESDYVKKEDVREFLNHKIKGCGELSGMEKEKWAFGQCSKWLNNENL